MNLQVLTCNFTYQKHQHRCFSLISQGIFKCILQILVIICLWTKPATGAVLQKKLFFKNFAMFTGKTCVGVSLY